MGKLSTAEEEVHSCFFLIHVFSMTLPLTVFVQRQQLVSLRATVGAHRPLYWGISDRLYSVFNLLLGLIY